jgi:hypothetical protein
MKITGKITSIKEDTISQAVVVNVLFMDEKGVSWEKKYNYNVTDVIALKDFQDRVKKDLVADLKPKSSTTELLANVGKEFTITI